MTTTTNPTRRGMLAGLGAVAALAGGAAANVVAIAAARPAAVPAALASPPAAVSEDPALIAMGREFDRLAAAYDAADAAYRAARAEAERLAPDVPADLQDRGDLPPELRQCWRYARDVEGQELPWPESIEGGERKVSRPPRVLCSEHLRGRSMPFHGPRTKAGKEVRRRLALAETYEAEVKAAADAAGLADARQEREWAATDLEAVAWQIGRAVPVTIAGVLIQARALATFDRIEHTKRPDATFSKAGLAIGRNLADAVLRIAGKGGVS